MSLSAEQIADLHDLLWELRAGTASPNELARLERMVCEVPAARAFYVRYMHLCADLHWSLAAKGEDGSQPRIAADAGGDPTIPPLPTGTPFILSIPLDTNQPSTINVSPLSSFPSFLFSYLIAAAVLGVALLAGWAWKVSENAQLAQQSTPDAASPNTSLPIEQTPWVGRVTGLFDCRWADAKTEAFEGAGVPVGRKYALASGLMEITYNSGTKVILEGPCAYAVESETGGHLSLGRLTAKVGGRGEGRGQSEKSPASRQPAIGRHRSPSPLSSLSSPLFSVRTPTAIVTDLGTEFGVEYDKSGVTRSFVFRGSVTLQPAAPDGTAQGSARILHENESARVEKSKAGQGGTLILLETLAKRPDFIRKMPKRTVKVFDLVDVVAGGNGFSHKRNGAVNPANGKILRNVDMFDYYRQHIDENVFTGDGRYHRVAGEPLIDGVFIPNGQQGPVQVDSAGHRFDGFPPTSNVGSGWIHGGGVIPCLADFTAKGNISCVLGGIDYSSPEHGVLFIHSNKGITFDLDAVRAANPNRRIAAFRAVAGLCPDGHEADLWVLVDGKPRFVRRRATEFAGAMPVDVPIHSGDRFLTLAATDSNKDITQDMAMFGDPRLELISDDSGERRTNDTGAAR